MQENNQYSTKKEYLGAKKEEKERKESETKKRQRLLRLAFWFLISGGLGLSVWGVAYFDALPEQQTAVLAQAVSASDNLWGSMGAKITVVEYSDFQCSACAFYLPWIKQLEDELGDELLLVFRHFPLRIHANAQSAAQAAEAAGLQGKFWEMHDQLFIGQSEWADKNEAEEIFVTYASSLGLNMEKFRDDMQSPEVVEKINNDYQGGQRSGVKATPTFFVNGRQIQPVGNYDEFKNTVFQAATPSS